MKCENIVHLKMVATDGKLRLTDVADTEQLLRIIQSIPLQKKLLTTLQDKILNKNKEERLWKTKMYQLW